MYSTSIKGGQLALNRPNTNMIRPTQNELPVYMVTTYGHDLNAQLYTTAPNALFPRKLLQGGEDTSFQFQAVI